ncbi:unnamed protein product [Fraxinus pennsylvanica]|uniref:NPH3 domain-containing protein n=1 Tax=Fraxinus pennsylvanica TaxID=56036 RepID=A0AAD2A4C4_9LAMI|nr:unnamed protein product [Fraxinus pennsylvanica]
MECQKLSLEASAHAAQNDRLHVQTVVQVQQQRIREVRIAVKYLERVGKDIEPRQEREKRVVSETVVSLLQREKNSKLDLEKKMAMQLGQTLLDDLLIPSYSFTGETLFDVETVQNNRDGMYRAIDIYLKANPVLSDVERKRESLQCDRVSKAFPGSLCPRCQNETPCPNRRLGALLITMAEVRIAVSVIPLHFQPKWISSPLTSIQYQMSSQFYAKKIRT